MNDDLLKQIVGKLDGLDTRMNHFEKRMTRCNYNWPNLERTQPKNKTAKVK